MPTNQLSKHTYRVVCTRRLEATWVKIARQRGVDVEGIDFLNVESVFNAELAATVCANESPWVFTSQHAVHSIEKILKKTAKPLATRIAYVTRGTTSAQAMAAGFELRGVGRNADELADSILFFEEKKVLHATSAIRLPVLSQRLSEAGVAYEACEVYQKTPLPRAVGAFDGVLFFSPSQVDVFLSINYLPAQVPVFCVGDTTAAHVRQRGHTRVLTAAEPTIESIFQTMFHHFFAQL
jgi:uroporphyrinogen-III synthase